MDVVGTFICVDSLKVSRMADDVVFIRDTVSTKHVSAFTSNGDSLAARVALDHGDHFRGKLVAILQTTDLDTSLKTKSNLKVPKEESEKRRANEMHHWQSNVISKETWHTSVCASAIFF